MGAQRTTETIINQAREWTRAAINEARDVIRDVSGDEVMVVRLEAMAAKLEVVDSILKTLRKETMPDPEVITNEIIAKKVDDVYIVLNQLWVQLTASGGPMQGAPLLMQSVPPYTEPYEVGGTGEQQLPNQFGYRT